MKRITLTINGMKCQGCVNSVKETLSGINGLKSVNVDLNNKKAAIECDDSIKPEVLIEQINSKTNFKASLIKEEII